MKQLDKERRRNLQRVPSLEEASLTMTTYFKMDEAWALL
jgi:hypothetical protein